MRTKPVRRHAGGPLHDSGKALGQAAANQWQGPGLLLHDRVGTATQKSHESVCPILSDLACERRGRRADERPQIGNDPVKRSVLLPQPLTFGRSEVGEGEMTGVERQGPAVIGRQALEISASQYRRDLG